MLHLHPSRNKMLGLQDCESGVSMKCRCRKLSSLIALLLSLASVLFFCNVSLVVKLGADVPYDLSTAGSGIPRIDDVLEEGADRLSAPKQRAALSGESLVSIPRKRQSKQRKSAFIKPVEQPSTSLSPNATFSACLLIKDDNDILSEWVAYHYHTLRLRQLIVAVDPLSSESPTDILHTWRQNSDLDIDEWQDADYMPKSFIESGKAPEKYMQNAEDFPTEEALLEVSNHRYRQRVFLAKCMKTLRSSGGSWVMHIDTDEFVVPSKLLRRMDPDYVTLAPMEESGSVLSLIQQVVKKAGVVSYPCISMLRVLFGSVESSTDEQYDKVPSGFNATAFESLRWRYHGLPNDMNLNGNPKVIVDVSAIAEKYFRDEVVYSIHRPVRDFCPKNKDLVFSDFQRQPIAVNHYLGSWERYSGRNDKRRSWSVYNAKASVNRGKDDGVRPWLRGFVQTLGFDTASKLLGDSYRANRTGADAVE